RRKFQQSQPQCLGRLPNIGWTCCPSSGQAPRNIKTCLRDSCQPPRTLQTDCCNPCSTSTTTRRSPSSETKSLALQISICTEDWATTRPLPLGNLPCLTSLMGRRAYLATVPVSFSTTRQYPCMGGAQSGIRATTRCKRACESSSA